MFLMFNLIIIWIWFNHSCQGHVIQRTGLIPVDRWKGALQEVQSPPVKLKVAQSALAA